MLEAIKEFIYVMQESKNFEKQINFNEKQILFNKFINERLEEIYNIDVLKNDFFKNDKWKKISLLVLSRDLNLVKEHILFLH